MREPDRFDISLFDRHPAFRLKRAFRTDPRHIRERASKPRNPNVWPLPSLDGSAPLVVGDCEEGVFVTYDPASDVPALVPVIAASDGVIKYAGKCGSTNTLVLDHGDGHRSYYSGIDHLFVIPTARRPREQRVTAGEILGYADTSKGDFQGVYFSVAIREGHWHYTPVDAGEVMRGWLVLPWTDDRIEPPPAVEQEAA